MPMTPQANSQETDGYDAQAEQLSAFIDSNLTDSQARLVAEQLSRSQVHQHTVLGYWLISDVLGATTTPDHRPALCQKIADQIAKEPVFLPQKVPLARVGQSRKPLSSGLRLAASLAALAFVGSGAIVILNLPTESDSATLMASGAPTVDARVMRASFDSPQARALLDAHGASHVRLRIEDR